MPCNQQHCYRNNRSVTEEIEVVAAIGFTSVLFNCEVNWPGSGVRFALFAAMRLRVRLCGLPFGSRLDYAIKRSLALDIISKLRLTL